MKHRDRPSLRLSAALQGVVERAGDSGAAIRGLMVLGAVAAGEDVGLLRREIAALLLDESLSDAVQRALSAVSDTRQTGVGHVSDTPAEASLMTIEQLDRLSEGEDDPLAGIGFEV
jgi:hypothetical protein